MIALLFSFLILLSQNVKDNMTNSIGTYQLCELIKSYYCIIPYHMVNINYMYNIIETFQIQEKMKYPTKKL